MRYNNTISRQEWCRIVFDKELLKEMSLFKGLQDNQLDDIEKHMKQTAIKSGDSIIKDGEIGDVMYILLNG